MATFRRRDARADAGSDAGNERLPADEYKIMLTRDIGPRLRELGFRGSGGVYTRPDPDYFVRIGFQKSVYGSKKHVKFTLNVSAINKVGWSAARLERQALPEEPAASTFYGTQHWQRRIGQLMPPQHLEPWWELGSDTDSSTLSREVLKVIEEVALPAIDQVTSARP